MSECMLCRGECEQRDDFVGDGLQFLVTCVRCGQYVVTDDASFILPSPEGLVKENLHLLSAVTRNSWENKARFTIDSPLLDDRSQFEAKVLSQCPQGVSEMLNGILLHLQVRSAYPGDHVVVNTERDYPLFFCRGPQELTFYLSHLKDTGMIDVFRSSSGDLSKVALLTPGWQRVEELRKPNIDSQQAFIAMWFSDEVDQAYMEGIANLKDDTGYHPLRIDMKQFNDKICDRIITEIRRSRFLIADVTGHRQGVYFEAGYAMGLGLPVVWTCREDQIDECHFDTRQYNHITWETAKELREKLRDRILATIGKAV